MKIRIFVLVKLGKRLKTMNSENAFDVTVMHNLKGLYHCNDRVKLLIKPLTAIEKVNKNSKVLIIGPRNEHDLYLMASEGIKMSNITGLDLITYSSRIKIGDMHEMEFADDTFDVVVFGWTLSYSSQPEKAIQEIVRVTKSGGLVAVGVEYTNLSKEDSESLLGYSIQEHEKLQDRINSTKQIINLFGSNGGKVYFDHDAPLKRSHTSKEKIQNVSNVAAIVEVIK
ncbi:MAG: class I SAM-dependent methyltransferase [Crocinitomicaceae bacterium]|nr:class I SAM-dependent methyltransferase [Crocinitomicaceae bacterium]